MATAGARLKIVSGGQTGVDRGALDAAIEAGVEVGGWCPKGRRAEDGPIASMYPLDETPDRDPAQRTRWNVRDSDATLVIGAAADSPGTQTTIAAAVDLGRPLFIIESDAPALDAVLEWMEREGVRTLNVAGPRESEASGIYERGRELILRLLGMHSARIAERDLE